MNKLIQNRLPVIYFILLTSLASITYHYFEWNIINKYPNGAFYINNGVTYGNGDNDYYFGPVENYLSGKGWRNNPPVGNGSYFRRTPGYSLVYLFARTITPNFKASLYVLIVINCVLYLLAFWSLSKILIYLKISNLVYNLSMVFIAIIPYFYHILLCTLTESISVYLTIISIFFLIKGYNEQNPKIKILSYVFASLFIGYDTLTRPYLGILLLLLPVFGYIEYYRFGIKRLLLNYIIIGIIPVLILGSWALRNYRLTKEIVFLEVAYHPQNLDRMKPEFRGFWNFVRCWGEDGAVFNNYQLPLYVNALKGDTSSQYIEKIIKHIPDDVIKTCGEQDIILLFKRYQQIVYSQKEYFDKQIAMPAQYSKEQIALENDFNSLTSKYIKENKITYYIFGPAKYLKQIIFHSNTVGIYFLQEQFRKYTVLNLLRYLSACIHISLFFFIFISIYTTRKKLPYFIIFVVVPVIYLLFFSYIVQTIEQRYFSPILPLLLFGAIYNINYFYERYIAKNTLSRP